MDFDSSRDAQMLECAANCWMLDLRDPLSHFNVRIHNPVAVFEKRRQIAASEVAVFVNRRGKHGTAIL